MKRLVLLAIIAIALATAAPAQVRTELSGHDIATAGTNR
jgi:hypothetical protein